MHIALWLGENRASPNRKQALQDADEAAVLWLTCGAPAVAGRCRAAAAAAARSPGGERSGARAWWGPFAGTLTQRSARRSKRNWFTLAAVRAPRGLGVVPPEGERGRPVCDRPHGQLGALAPPNPLISRRAAALRKQRTRETRTPRTMPPLLRMEGEEGATVLRVQPLGNTKSARLLLMR